MLKQRWYAVWLRNFNVWRKLWLASLLGNFGDPLIYLLALGFGLGSIIKSLDGMPYIVFLASGIVCSSAMNAANFEAMFSGYTRMSSQKTWEAMLSTPLSIRDVILGETFWAATKGLINSTAILIVAIILGLVSSWKVIFVLPIIFLMSTCFAAMGLIVTGLAKGYDYFTYYITLLVTPMMMLSGVFFPLDEMPHAVQMLAKALPLHHAIVLVRPLMAGGTVSNVVLHLAVLLIYTLVAYTIAVKLIQKRLIS